MPKVTITDPKGFYFNKQQHAEGDEIEIPAGARLDAALHFKQVEVIKPKKEDADAKKTSDPKK